MSQPSGVSAVYVYSETVLCCKNDGDQKEMGKNGLPVEHMEPVLSRDLSIFRESYRLIHDHLAQRERSAETKRCNTGCGNYRGQML